MHLSETLAADLGSARAQLSEAGSFMRDALAGMSEIQREHNMMGSMQLEDSQDAAVSGVQERMDQLAREKAEMQHQCQHWKGLHDALVRSNGSASEYAPSDSQVRHYQIAPWIM